MPQIMPELHAIGIDLAPVPDLAQLLFDSGISGIEKHDDFEMVGLYVDKSGAKVAMGSCKGRVYVDAGLVSTQEYPAEVFRITDTLAHVDLLDTNGETVTRFLAYVDDPTAYPYYDLAAVGEARTAQIRVGALGAKVRVFADLEAYRISQESSDEDLLQDLHLASAWLFALYAGSCQVSDVNGIALLAVLCDSVELRTNELTGQPFWYVTGNCGVADIAVAVAADISPSPVPGAVIAGHFLLTISDGVLEAIVADK